VVCGVWSLTGSEQRLQPLFMELCRRKGQGERWGHAEVCLFVSGVWGTNRPLLRGERGHAVLRAHCYHLHWRLKEELRLTLSHNLFSFSPVSSLPFLEWYVDNRRWLYYVNLFSVVCCAFLFNIFTTCFLFYIQYAVPLYITTMY